jgi:hypothetical protein
LKLALDARADPPFIFVSGSLGEEVAIDAVKIGATDYHPQRYLGLRSRRRKQGLAPKVRSHNAAFARAPLLHAEVPRPSM